MTLGEKIQLSRKKKGMSQEDLANLLNVSRQAVQKWESGASTPELNKIIEISNVFEVSLDWLIKDIPEEELKETKEESLHEEVHKEVKKPKNNYTVTKVFLIIGMVLTPIMFTVPIMRQFNSEKQGVVFVVLAIMYVIELILGLPALAALKNGKSKKEIIGLGIMSLVCISGIGGVLMLASKDAFHPNKDEYKDKYINRTAYGALGIGMGVFLLVLSIVAISIYGTVTDPKFVFLYMDLFIQFLLMGIGSLIGGILEFSLVPERK